MIHVNNTTTEYIITNAPSQPVYFEPAVIVYHRRFQMDPAVMLTYHRRFAHHRRFVIRPGGDAVESITARSYYEPAVIRKHHRRIVI